IEEPQSAIICQSRLSGVLDMTSPESKGNRKASLDIAKEDTRRLKSLIVEPPPTHQCTMDRWTRIKNPRRQLFMPSTINWGALKDVYEFQPNSYEELVSTRGVGSSTIRGISLIAELLYGEEASWKDPVRFSFAFGGKDGVPFPVDRRAMDEAVDLLRTGIESASVKKEQKLRALRRLRRCVPPIPGERLISMGS
ncbi:MAG: DUF763 domain-containing protein, partial [Desulfobacterales bacterium]|nr:DUF763 domain-containing protein [Desulfobacterales bacterium]